MIKQKINVNFTDVCSAGYAQIIQKTDRGNYEKDIRDVIGRNGKSF